MKKIAFVLTACLPSILACGGADTQSSKQAVGDIAEEGDRCGGFVAHPKQCDESANLYCKYSGVPDMPGTCTSCDQYAPAPLSPLTLCDDGNTYTAHWVAQNGACVIQTCPDGNPGTTVGSQCQAASDCTGFLPQNCMQCADGTSQCAHWDCNAGSCVTVTCDDNGGPAPTCIDTVMCMNGFHWDGTQCACVANTPCFADTDCSGGQTCNFSVVAADGSGFCSN